MVSTVYSVYKILVNFKVSNNTVIHSGSFDLILLIYFYFLHANPKCIWSYSLIYDMLQRSSFFPHIGIQ